MAGDEPDHRATGGTFEDQTAEEPGEGPVDCAAPADASDGDDGPHILSPYTGGGGGTVLGHRVATVYLAEMLRGVGRPETDELPIVRVAFQTNPDPVDDLRVEAGRNDDNVVVHVAVRRSPNFVKSHTKTAELVGTLLDQVAAFEPDQRAYVAVALVAMSNPHRQVQQLASLARGNDDEAAFYAQVHVKGRHADLESRYDHLTGLIAKARPKADASTLRELVWTLLQRLWLLDFRVESDDETDWANTGNQLTPLARAGKTGADVRDRLHSACATQFDQKGTQVDRAVARRFIHSVLAPDGGRTTAAWTQLREDHNSALVAVQHSLAGSLELPRTKLRRGVQDHLTAAGTSHIAVMVTGESGTGKSALTLSVATALAEANDDFEFVALNLRWTRDSVAALSADLGMPLSEVLREMTAPSRVLVVDAADAAPEGRTVLLRELAAAAHQAELGLVLVVADTAAADVADALIGLYAERRRVDIPGLDDTELTVVADAVPAIAGALRNLPTTSLYRRFVVVDLLARTGATVSRPLDDWDCLNLIWDKLIARAVPGQSSGEARSQALLALSEHALGLPAPAKTYPDPDPTAIETLRADRLVAPRDLMRPYAEFAHDEIRRFATAIRLAQAESVAAVLGTSGPPRWSMSAAKLACEGKLSRAEHPDAALATLLAQFDALGDASSVRWKDVPLEAVLELPDAFDLLANMLAADVAQADDVLATFVRVVSLHHRHDDMVDVTRGAPVVRLLIQEIDQLWCREDEAFVLLVEWLNSALLENIPAGDPIRAALRQRLLEHWRTHYPPVVSAHSDNPVESAEALAGSKSVARGEASAEGAECPVVVSRFGGSESSRRKRRRLPYQIVAERYVQLLALLGPDIDEDVRACLEEVAADSPSRLKPAVDLSWSAWGLGLYDPTLLLELTEIYYIDRRGSGGSLSWNGIRDHQYRGGAMSRYDYGSFWVLLRLCDHREWIPVVNRILNHAATNQCDSRDGDGRRGGRGLGGQATVDADSTFTLSIDGTERTYVGDGGVWSWYRGGTKGPYPCMSALQAVERWFDNAVAAGAQLKKIAESLLDGCENLAMPALIVGALVRHVDRDPRALDTYLREPLVWQFESYRAGHEALNFLRPSNEGIAHPERRAWSMREVATLLLLNGNSERHAELRALGEELIANTKHFDATESTVHGWAAMLDVANVRTELVNNGVMISVDEPPELEAELAPLRADLARTYQLIGLQNKYWIPPRQQADGWSPPTPSEVAEDLAAAKAIFEDPPGFAASEPLLAIAYIAAAAIKWAAQGHADAFGDKATFAITTTLDIVRSYAEPGDDDDYPLRFENDIGTRGAAASAIPHLLLPALAEQVQAAGAGPSDVLDVATILGSRAATETCLEFARGCDDVWTHPCTCDPCIHATAYRSVLELARACEIGEFHEEEQRSPHLHITDDVVARVPHIDPERLDTGRLSASIRALGRAAAISSCIAFSAQQDLTAFLRAQVAAMVAQETSEDRHFIDDRDAQTISAARALLHNRSRPDVTDDLLLECLTVLAPDAHLLSAFLRDIAAVGAETQELADAAADVWPVVMTHVLDQVDAHQTIYNVRETSTDYALSHLVPNVDGTPDARNSELGRDTINWVRVEEVTPLIPRWLRIAAGRSTCLLELIRFLRQLPAEQQLSDGLGWIGDLCLSNPNEQLPTYPPMDEWLIEIKSEADSKGAGADWLDLVDRLVYAGNRTLAHFSR